jgi:DNA-binding NarL/FixJ family response regulator
VQAALAVGAKGYVVKTDAGSELLSAVNAVLHGERFVSSSLAGIDFSVFRPKPQHPLRAYRVQLLE